MLTLENTEELLLRQGFGEEVYRELYSRCPEAYQEPIHNWDELRMRFGRPIMEEPPTIVKEYLTEAEFFALKDLPVSCFANVRFCPPFLHKLEFIKIVYILKGTAFFYLNGRKYEMHEGNFCIVSPGLEQAVFTGDDTSVAVNILLKASTFTEAFSAILTEQGVLADFFGKLAYTKYYNRVLFFTCGPDEKMKNAVLRLFHELNQEKQPSSLICESYVCIFLGEGIRKHRHELIYLEGLDEKVFPIPDILQYMKKHMRDITLEELAEKWGKGRREEDIQFELKMETGYSFNSLLADLRLQKAADLLRKTQRSIEAIMEEIGWKDSAAFYRSFRKRYGKTPQDYRTHV